ncbi:uncharacterized protein BDZ99DRAFT_413188 [Mytilinidion resinicola]|uniref:Uncharacterized protein n=1 Tax=Mytilinidion resinicola TaxID=574789 RepID=A0A6A6YU44_9PEZI|nr:uncharacterized protein BDZ99DRAFT_413188 [Mytilinidion resinicola]KAF2812452.1 hypothetical protein BDZ99DRAFT_413188 [Mytilinidion resinicola]
MPSQPGSIRQAWYNWKKMKLPWRKRWLVGFDLSGNTYWEFKDAINQNRVRRIAKYAGSTHHSDVNVSPQWMQWLRHTRADPPSLNEQRADVMRVEQTKVLAAAADQRWASKPSMLDPPDKQQPTPMLASREPAISLAHDEPSDIPKSLGDAPQEAGVKPKRAASHGLNNKGEVKESPWYKGPKGGPSEDWQPEAWSPSPVRKRA